MRKWAARRRAKKDVLLAARCVAVGYVPELATTTPYDPDDLEHLRVAVTRLYDLEGQSGAVLS